MKTINLNHAIKFRGDDFTNISLSTYTDGKIAIVVNTDENRERFEQETVILTVNIENTTQDEIAVDDKNNDFDFCYEVIEQLVEMGVVEDENKMKQSGYNSYSIYKVLIDRDKIVKKD